jgi:hypothetical protein
MRWQNVTASTGMPGKPTRLRADQGQYIAEVTRIGPVAVWSVFGPKYQGALYSGETDSIETATRAAESALRTAIDECG